MITTSCDKCGETYMAPEEHAGKQLRCRRCGRAVPIEKPSSFPTLAPPILEPFFDYPASGAAPRQSQHPHPRRAAKRPPVLLLVTAGALLLIALFAVCHRVAPRGFFTPLAPPVSLPNGTLVVGTDAPSATAFCELRIENGNDQDALLKLKQSAATTASATRPGTTRYAIYIRAGQSATLKHIAPGEYRLIFSLGSDWDKVTRSFRRDTSFALVEQPVRFEQDWTADGLNGSRYRVTLHPVPTGTARTRAVFEREFAQD